MVLSAIINNTSVVSTFHLDYNSNDETTRQRKLLDFVTAQIKRGKVLLIYNLKILFQKFYEDITTSGTCFKYQNPHKVLVLCCC